MSAGAPARRRVPGRRLRSRHRAVVRRTTASTTSGPGCAGRSPSRCMTAAVALLFRWCPNRRQPAWSWLAFGSAVPSCCGSSITLVMGFVFEATTSFGDTYGPLAGIVVLQFWALLASIAVFFGGAVAAQLEAVRAGVPLAAEAEARPAGGRVEPSRRCRFVSVADPVALDPGAEGDPGQRIRRCLEGVLGIPATEGNAIDVLRNGDEIFPAMFEAIDAAERTDRLPHLRLLGGRDRRGDGRPSLRPGQGGRAGAHPPRRARRPHHRQPAARGHGRERLSTSAGSAVCAACGPARSTTAPTARS